MTDTLVGANILVDLFAADPDWRDRSARRLPAASREGRLIVSRFPTLKIITPETQP